MSGVVLQILQILAFLAIGLISVTFPVYAICVTYLKPEIWETRKARNKRIEELKENIAKRTEELSGEEKLTLRFNELQKEIKNCKLELRKQRLRVFYLQAIGAVGLPLTLLVLALFFATLGMYFFYEGSEYWAMFGILGSSIFSGTALCCLYKTISIVEYAALRPTRSLDFDVFFAKKYSKEMTIERGKKTSITIHAGTADDDLEDFRIRIYIHPDIEILDMLVSEASVTLQPEGFDFSGYQMIWRGIDYCAKEIYEATVFNVSAGKVGSYKIPVWLQARGAKMHKDELTLNVVKSIKTRKDRA